MTLLEVTIALSLLSTALAALFLTVDASQNAYRQTASNTLLFSRTARAMQHLLRELTPAQASSLSPSDPDGSDDITFQAVIGSNGGNSELGEVTRFRLELSPVELDNGIDDDGNGLVDERVLVQILDPGGVDERRRVVVRNVSELLEGELENGLDDNGNGLADEPGLSFDVVGDTLTIRLSIQGAVGRWQARTETLETAVTLRN